MASTRSGSCSRSSVDGKVWTYMPQSRIWLNGAGLPATLSRGFDRATIILAGVNIEQGNPAQRSLECRLGMLDQPPIVRLKRARPPLEHIPTGLGRFVHWRREHTK